MSRLLVLLALVALLCYVCVLAVLRIAVPPPVPAGVAARAPVGARLSRHLLFVIVDGLRYDVAMNARRMPHFARAMREHRSAEIWAGPVSMTSSAILAYGTGQPGGLEQIVHNLSPARTRLNSWLENAHARGLEIAVVGDPAWVKMYGESIAAKRLDPKGAAIDVDFNPETFRGVRELRAGSPDVLIAHFVTPDHQAHAYGVHSARYAAHIRNYDAELAGMLREFGPDWTVIVTSDHGAADTGTHGADVPIQRRSPIYAYGPGIAPPSSVPESLDQLDMAATFAALLGVSAPAHGRGQVLIDWLTLAPEERAALACDSAVRLAELASAAGATNVRDGTLRCNARQNPEETLTLAARASSAARASLTELGSSTFRAWWLVLCAVALAVGILWLLQGANIVSAAPLALGVLVATVVGLYYNERLPGHGPNAVRLFFFVVCNVPALLLLLRPARAAELVEAHPVAASVIAPGLLAVSYTAHVQPESYALIWVGALAFVFSGRLGPGAVAP
ncbi:MAG TPA: alkaline phosphatase family protein, partial [Polyangiaceae bacterium]|nr:alkaline phosphatase family protein [Polyangiaceae bacterium]